MVWTQLNLIKIYGETTMHLCDPAFVYPIKVLMTHGERTGGAGPIGYTPHSVILAGVLEEMERARAVLSGIAGEP